jgi:Leucine-rich repeat (LRR) protein
MIHQIYTSDKKSIDYLKTKCDFDYRLEENFCTEISFYKEEAVFGSTIRKNENKDEIINIISKFPKLKFLNLRKCRANEIPEFVSKDLKHIDISCNNIDKFPPWILKQLSLNFLNIGANNIKEVPDLSHLKIETLKLHKNKIKNIPNINNAIKSLNLYLNQEICDFPKNIEKLNNIEIFSFGVSKIKELPSLICWPKLRWLTVTVNNIESINDDTCELKNLEGLQLAKNNIKVLPEKIGEMNLKCISLYSNEISYLPTSFYDLRLTKLNLSKNPLMCKTRVLEKFKTIDFLRM